MRWFPGKLELAMQVSLRNKALLIVFIESDDEKGKIMSQTWEQIEPSSFSCNHVAVHLQEGDDMARAFAAKYPASSLPATFFINCDGDIIDTLTDAESSQFHPKIVSVVEKFLECTKESSTSVSSAASSSAASHPTFTAPSTARTSFEMSLEEKIRRAKEKLDVKKKEEAEAKKKEDKQKELDRIQTGKLTSENQKKKQEKELLEAAEERRKDKLLAEQTKSRVRAQIQADKEEREYRERLRAGVSTSTPSQPKEDVVLNKPIRSDHCRVMIRFIDGNSITDEFLASEPLSKVLDVIHNSGFVTGSFSLVNSYPRKVFEDVEFGKSFMDLSLTPSCTLFVEQKQKNVTTVNTTGGIYSLISLILIAPWNCLCALYRLIFQRKETTSGTVSSSASQPRQSQNSQRRTNQGNFSAATIRRRGNVSGLHNRNGDDSDPDENPNWNGNSTQFL